MTELTTLPNNGRGKEVLNKWELYIVSRLISFQSLLSISDRVNTGLLFSPYEMKASKNDVEKNILIQPSNHLERWKKWKLDNEKIERLTKVAMNIEKNEILKFFEEKLDKFRFFARGKRGILFAGERKEDQLPVVVKLSAENGNPMTIKPIDIEAKWISILNRVGIGARLLARGTGWFMCERLNGQPICDFLSSASREEAKWAIRELLCQCFTMDRLGINKDEMTHPNRHIIIHQQTISFPRKDPRLVCTFIDFEKCSFTSKPKNITQICQFLCSPYMTKLLSERGIVNDVMKMRQCTKAYKQTPSSKTFQVIMKHFQL